MEAHCYWPASDTGLDSTLLDGDMIKTQNGRIVSTDSGYIFTFISQTCLKQTIWASRTHFTRMGLCCRTLNRPRTNSNVSQKTVGFDLVLSDWLLACSFPPSDKQILCPPCRSCCFGPVLNIFFLHIFNISFAQFISVDPSLEKHVNWTRQCRPPSTFPILHFFDIIFTNTMAWWCGSTFASCGLTVSSSKSCSSDTWFLVYVLMDLEMSYIHHSNEIKSWERGF